MDKNDDLIYDTRQTCFHTACGVEGKLCPDCATGSHTKDRRKPVPKLAAYERISRELEQAKLENAALMELFFICRELYPLRHLALPLEDQADDPLILFNKIKKLGPALLKISNPSEVKNVESGH